jgi:hypothetical protein
MYAFLVIGLTTVVSRRDTDGELIGRHVTSRTCKSTFVGTSGGDIHMWHEDIVSVTTFPQAADFRGTFLSAAARTTFHFRRQNFPCLVETGESA